MSQDKRVTRKLSAILSADVKGYSLLMADEEVHTIETLKAYRQIISDLVLKHSGRVVDSPGDNILAEFRSSVDAVECAVKIQKRLDQENSGYPDDKKVEFRIGVNVGDVIQDGDRIYGNGVNVAARIEGLSEPGGVCVSRNAYDHIRDKLDLGYEYLGEHSVKNIKQPVRVYKVLMDPEDAGKLIGVKRKSSAKKWAWPIAAAIVVLSGFVAWQVYEKQTMPEIEPASVENMAYPLPDKPSIAVLPFDNMSGDSEQEYFSDGLSEEIITALSSVPELFVIARNSSFTYKGKPVKVQQISEDLGVQYVLEGSVRKTGEKVRITAQLIDALKGHHLWAETYDRNFEDLFDLQEEISLKIITELRVKLTKKEDARFAAPCSEDLRAYRKYLKALDHFYRMNRQDNVVAQRLAEEAIELDPGYACAYSLLGGIHRNAVDLGISNSPAQSLAMAKELVEKAIDLDPALPGPYAVLSHVYRSMGQYDKSIEEAEKALTLNPNSVLGNGAMGSILMYVGRSEESVAYYEKAIRFDPFSTVYFPFLGFSYFFSGQYQKAIGVCKRAQDSWPNDFFVQICLASAYSAAGHEEEARAAASEILKMNPKFSLEWFSKRVRSRFKKQADIELYISSLRKAGLPEHPPLPLPEKPSIAVLAFDNLSGDPDQEFFSDGISEEIISALSKTDQLFVIARNSSFTYKGKPIKVQQVARELGVRYVLEGSVRKSDNRVRITAQLIDATSGHHLWSERYDHELKDIFALQDEITMKIVTALQVELTDGEQMRILAKRYKRLDVLLKAMELISITQEGTQESVVRWGQLAQEIVDMAPELSVGYRHLGWYHFMLAAWGKSPQENLKKAYGFALRAISLDEYDGMSHGLLGNVYLRMRQHEKAISEGKRAVELDPNSADVNMYLGFSLTYAGKPDEAIEYLNKAYRLNPFPPFYIPYLLGNCYLQKGNYEKALIEYTKALQLAPNAAQLYGWLAMNYILLGRAEEAHEAFEKSLELAPYFSISLFAKTQPYKNQADLEFMLETMRKAGFPE